MTAGTGISRRIHSPGTNDTHIRLSTSRNKHNNKINMESIWKKFDHIKIQNATIFVEKDPSNIGAYYE